MQAKQLGLEGVPKKDEGLSLEFLMRVTKLKDRRLQQLADDGVIKRVGRGRYSVTAVTDYIVHLRNRAEGKGYKAGEDAKERKLLAEAEFWELRVLERKKDLHRQRDIERLLQSAFITFKKQLQALPNIKAPQWHLAPDPQTLREMVNSDFERILNELVETALSLSEMTEEIDEKDPPTDDDDDELESEPNELAEAYSDSVEDALRAIATNEDSETQ